MKKLISVCIPTYGRSVYLQTAVRSVLEQEHRPLEILVGDDSPNEENHAFIASLPRGEGVSVRQRGDILDVTPESFDFA